MSDGQVSVQNNPEANRYEVVVGDELAGFAVYRLAPGRVIFVHTEIEDTWEGRGLGTELASAALDDVRQQGKRATPLCPFIAAFIRTHPEYLDLVDDEHQARLRDAAS